MDSIILVSAHLSNGVDGVPALWQDIGVGVIQKADKAWQQSACMNAVVLAGASKVAIEDGDGGLSEPGVSSSRCLQQVFYDDSLSHFILHREDHRLTAAQLLNQTEHANVLVTHQSFIFCKLK